MNKKFDRCVRWPSFRVLRSKFTAVLSVAMLAACLPQATFAETASYKFDKLTVRGTTYTQVEVQDINKRHVSFRSAQGFGTVLIEDLDPAAAAKIGRGDPKLAEAAQAASAVKEAPNPEAGVPVHAREKPDADAEAEDEESDFTDEPFQWTVASVSGVGMCGLGLLTMLAGQIWLICSAFRVSTGWGVALIFGTFIAGIITTMFCRSHWDEAKRPVVLKMAGVALAVLGYFMIG